MKLKSMSSVAALKKIKNLVLIFCKLNRFAWTYRQKILRSFLASLRGERILVNDVYLVLSRFVSQESIRYALQLLSCFKGKFTFLDVLTLYTSYKVGDNVGVIASISSFERSGGVQAKLLEFHFFREIIKNYWDRSDHTLVERIIRIESPEDAKIVAIFFIENGLRLSTALVERCRSYNSIFNIYSIDSADQVAAQVFPIRNSRVYEFVEPHCFQEEIDLISRSVVLPKQVVWTLSDVSLIGGFQVLRGSKFVIYEEAADPRNGFVAGIWKFIRNIPDEDSVVVNFTYQEKEFFESGILISGRCTSNYFHWLIEDVPKILSVVLADLPRSSPLIVQKGMFKQHHDFIKFIASKFGYSILEIDSHELASFKKLYIPAPLAFHPDDPKYEYWEAAGVCAESILAVREWGLECLSGSNISRRTVGGRYYLSRRGNLARGISNEDEIERVALKYGFEIIRPEKLSFVEQVDLFHGADVIVSPAGAALANIIFCRPAAKIFSLLAGINRGFSVQSNLAVAVGCSFEHVTGEMNTSREDFATFDEYRFSGFSLDIKKVEKLFESHQEAGCCK